MNNEQIRMESYGDFKVEVFNAHGEQQKVQYSDNAIDISFLPSGQYTICFRIGNETYLERLIK